MKSQKENMDKLTDKAFMRLIVTSFAAIILCLACLGSTTWALFSDVFPSEKNEIRSAEKCLLTVSIASAENESNSSRASVETADATESTETGDETVILDKVNEEKSLDLASGTYTVTMTLPKSSASGYLVISCGEQKYYTDFLERHENDVPSTLTFTLKVDAGDPVAPATEATLAIEFVPRWGIYAGDTHVKNGGTLEVKADK